MAKTIKRLDDLQPDASNANKGTVRGRGMVEASLRETGAGRSILADREGRIIAGNKTLEAWADIGGEIEVVRTKGDKLVVVQREDLDLTDESGTARKLAYYDNRAGEVGLEWDAEQLLADLSAGVDLSALFRDDELDALLQDLQPKPEVNDGGAQVDRAEELRVKWQVEAGQLWQLGEHRLICGDCTDAEVVARVMGGERADCVFTSPPYAVGVDYGETYQDTIDNLRSMLPKLAAIFWDIVTDGGYAVINFGDIAPASDIAKVDGPCEYPMAIEYWPIFRAAGWVLWSRRIWCKPNARVNSLWCISSNRAATDWEHLWTWKKDGEAIVKRVDGELRSPSGWYQSSQMDGVEVGKEDHGAGMAAGIAQWMVNVHSRNGGIVFEPFSGSGTAIIACEQLGRRCRAVEISPAYVAVALDRWATATGQTPVLV